MKVNNFLFEIHIELNVCFPLQSNLATNNMHIVLTMYTIRTYNNMQYIHIKYKYV